MKKFLLLLPLLSLCLTASAQQGLYTKDNSVNCPCFEQYYKTFTERGAFPVPDGEHNVVFSARTDSTCFCGEGKITVKNGNIVPGLLIKKSDGSYERSQKTLHVKTNTGEGENPAKFTITSGMSASFSADDYTIVNLFFIDFLKTENTKNVIAPDPQKIAGRKAELSASEKELIQKVYEGLVFETGKSLIKKESYAHLNLLADMLQEKKDYQLTLNGYTDNVGKAESNLVLSKKRADSVKNYLVKRGVDATRITSEGFGVENPIGDNATKEGRSKNRRVEFVITTMQ